MAEEGNLLAEARKAVLGSDARRKMPASSSAGHHFQLGRDTSFPYLLRVEIQAGKHSKAQGL